MSTTALSPNQLPPALQSAAQQMLAMINADSFDAENVQNLNAEGNDTDIDYADYLQFYHDSAFGDLGNPQVLPNEFLQVADFLKKHGLHKLVVKKNEKEVPQTIASLNRKQWLLPSQFENAKLKKLAQAVLVAWNNTRGESARYLTPIIAEEILNGARVRGNGQEEKTCPHDFSDFIADYTGSSGYGMDPGDKPLGFDFQDFIAFAKYLKEKKGYTNLPDTSLVAQTLESPGVIPARTPHSTVATETEVHQLITAFRERYAKGQVKAQIQMNKMEVGEELPASTTQWVDKQMDVLKKGFDYVRQQKPALLNSTGVERFTNLYHNCPTDMDSLELAMAIGKTAKVLPEQIQKDLDEVITGFIVLTETTRKPGDTFGFDPNSMSQALHAILALAENDLPLDQCTKQ